LATKNVWRIIQGIGIWIQVVKYEYITPNTMEEWVRNTVKKAQNVSIMWKEIIYAIHLV